MNELTKRIIKIVIMLVTPFLVLWILGTGLVMSFVIGLIMDAFMAVAIFLHNKQMAKVKDMSYEEICDLSTQILFQLKQDGEIIESVTLTPHFIEIEHSKSEEAETDKSTIPFTSWGVDGSKTYLHASRAVKDYLGKSYSILMSGEYIIIAKKKEKTRK